MAIQMDRIAAFLKGAIPRWRSCFATGPRRPPPHRRARRFPDRRLRPRCRRWLPGTARRRCGRAATTARSRCRRFRRHLGRRARPARLDARRRAEPRDRRARRQRRPARPAAGADGGKLGRDHHAPQGRGHPRAADRHAGAAQSRPRYGAAFEAVFPQLAQEHDLPLYPFFLDGVAGEALLNQGDGIHPTPEGIAIIVEKILPTVTDWLDATS